MRTHIRSWLSTTEKNVRRILRMVLEANGRVVSALVTSGRAVVDNALSATAAAGLPCSQSRVIGRSSLRRICNAAAPQPVMLEATSAAMSLRYGVLEWSLWSDRPPRHPGWRGLGIDRNEP